MNFTFNEQKHELTVEDGGVIRRFILYDNLWEITYLILKAIDELDDGGSVSVEVADWARPNSSEKIPVDKLDTGTEPGQIPVLTEEGTLPSGTIDPQTVLDGIEHLVLKGGEI